MASKIGRQTAQRIRDAWPSANSLTEAMRMAGVKTQDRRTWYRYRKQTEAIFGIELPAHNQQLSPEKNENQCPSYLDHKKAGKSKSFIITSATNNSNLNAKFFDTLEAFSDETGAQLLVIPIKYRHNTLIRRDDYAWPSRIYPYAVNQDIIVNKSLVVAALNLIATAVNPLSGLQENSGSRSAIYGHTQVALNCVATPGNDDPKIITTTGSCTSATYTKTKQGGKAKFHHSFSAVYVKVVGQKFHFTHMHWDGKGAYLLSDYWTPEGRTDAPQAAALVQGDSHAVYSERAILQARNRLLSTVDAQALVWNDLHDHKYQSHHNTRLDRIKLAMSGEFMVEQELEKAEDLINYYGKGRLNLIVGSNHDDALDKWIDRFNPDKDPHNAVFAWELGAKSMRSGKPAFQTWLEPRLKVKAKFLDRNKAYKIKGIDNSRRQGKIRASLVSD